MAIPDRHGQMISETTRSLLVEPGAASELHIGEVGMATVDLTDSWTRVADTNAYTIADVIAATVSNTDTTALRSLALGRSGTRGFALRFLSVAFQKTDFLPTIRVHFYNVAAPTTALAGDNVTFVQYYANRAQKLGFVDLPAHTLYHAGDDYTNAYKDNLDLILVPVAGLIYYRLEIVGGTSITPSSAMPVNLRLRAVQL